MLLFESPKTNIISSKIWGMGKSKKDLIFILGLYACKGGGKIASKVKVTFL